MKKANAVLFTIVATCGLLACNSNDEQNAFLQVRLTDAPGDFQEVNIDIQRIEVNAGEDEGGWRTLDVNQGTYNLLELSAGLDTLLAQAELPAGRISQIRLILGDNNSIKMNDEMISLETPSAQQSGLKLNIKADLVAGVTYSMLLDFDAARSIVNTGSGKYILKPVIRTIVEASSGAIKGNVTPVESTPAVYVIAGADTVATAYADQSTGVFLLRGVPEGEYSVTFEPGGGYLPQVQQNVSVSIGQVTDLGKITISN